MTDNIFKKGQKATVIAGLATILFACLKAVVGLISGSLVLTADALHSAADSFSTFLAWFGLKIAQKKPTQKFPYGFYKAESITSFLISGLILFAGYEIIKGSIVKMTTSYILKIPLVAISTSLLDALVMFIIGTYELGVGRKINSRSLMADGTESRTHIFSSSIVLVGLVASWLKIPYLEGLMGLIISIFIFKIGIESMKDSVFALMDVSPSKDIENKIQEILKQSPAIQEFGELKLRKSGPFVFGEVKVKMAKNIRVETAHEIVDNVEQKIKTQIPQVDSFLVHVEPLQKEEQKIIIPVAEKNGLDSKICTIFSRAKYFAILLVKKENQSQKIEFKENLFRKKEIRAGLSVARYLLQEKPDILITKEMGPISFHTMRDSLVDIYKTEKETVAAALDEFKKGKLTRLEEPTKNKG